MRGRSIFGGLLIILLGLLFLLNNLGLIGWDIWLVYIDFWPLLLIALGIRLIFRKNRTVQIIVLVLIFVVPAIYYLGYGGNASSRWVHPGDMRNYGTYNWSLTENKEIKKARIR